MSRRLLVSFLCFVAVLCYPGYFAKRTLSKIAENAFSYLL